MSYYEKHVFVCTNQKIAGKTCCANTGGEPVFNELKTALLELDLFGPGKVRVSKSGCLGRCSQGPCVVIYPEGIWYKCDTSEDIHKIIEEHLVNNQQVTSLIISD